MKLAIVSDLHLNSINLSDAFFQETADVLLIAGDTCESRHLKKFDKVFKRICNCYERVFIICGNHEFYYNFHSDTLEQFEKFTKKFSNLQFLNNEVVDFLNGYRLIASTLWTDCNKQNPITMNVVKTAVDDYKLIKVLDPHYRKLQPADTVKLHKENIQFITEYLNHDKIIMLTHHAPTLMGCYNNQGDYAFASDLSDLILNNPQIKYWFHGHTHNSIEYEVGSCKIISNQRGYSHEQFKNVYESFIPKIIEI